MPQHRDIKAEIAGREREGPFGAHAEMLVKAGYSPLPIMPGEKRPALMAWSEYCRRQMPERQRARYAHCGIGVACGYAGLVAIDIDTDEAEIIKAIRPLLPASPVSKVGKKGWTAFYRAAPDVVATKLKPFVEILADGNQTVIPPTMHPGLGEPYVWLADSVPLWEIAPADLPMLPETIADQLREALRPWLSERDDYGTGEPIKVRTSEKPPEGRERKRYEAYAAKVLEGRTSDLAAMGKDSGRNVAVFHAVCTVGRYVHHGILSQSQVESALRGACEQNGLAAEDGKRSITATIGKGFQKSKGDALPELPERERQAPKARAKLNGAHPAETEIAGAAKSESQNESDAAIGKSEGNYSNSMQGEGAAPGALRRDGSGKLYKDEGNTLIALESAGIEVSYDEFADRHLIEGLEGYGPELNDAALQELRLMVWREFYLKMPMTDFEPIVLSQSRRNRFHPVKDYLESLKWDGTERLEHWIIDHGGADESPYVRAVSRIVLTAAVRRIYQPGAHFRLMPVLESKQGGAKSSAARVLMPYPEWLEESLSLQADPKVVIEQTAGKWLVEIGELSGIRNKDVEHVKAFISRTTDRARMAYAKSVTDKPRPFIFIGTTNDDRYLRDSTGNTRFCPVRIDEFDLDGLAAARDQLWAEAMHRHLQGDSIQLPPELYDDARQVQESRRITDPWQDILADHLEGVQGKISARDVWRLVGRPTGHRTQHDNERIGSAMRELGWSRKLVKIDRKAVRGYVRGNSPYSQLDVSEAGDGKFDIDVKLPSLSGEDDDES